MSANKKDPDADGNSIGQLLVRVKDRGFLDCSIDNGDPDADLTIFPIDIDDRVFDILALAPSMLLTPALAQSEQINETDEVLFSGLFLSYSGEKRNYPIVRHGKLALIPKEKIPWEKIDGTKSMQDLYLAEVTFWGE